MELKIIITIHEYFNVTVNSNLIEMEQIEGDMVSYALEALLE